jgi:tetratricopeptide (TPR) repeat protein
MLKKLFGGGSSGQKQADQELSVDDLIVLERYEEAEAKLQARLRSNQRDLHSRLKLADVYIGLRQASKAVDEYIYVAEEYADDGFHDKALALLARAQKLAPADTTLAGKIEKIKTSKKLEHSRVLAIEGILAKGKGSTNSGTSALELQRLWHNLSGSALVRRLEGEQLKRLFAAMELERIGGDVVLVERGASLEKLLLIVEGTIEAVVPRAGGGWTVLRGFSSGDLIGDRALFERRPWPATYRTTGTVTALSLERQGLEQALLGNPDPRGFLSALRAGADLEVAGLVQKLGA